MITTYSSLRGIDLTRRSCCGLFGCAAALIIKVNHDTHYSNFFMRALWRYAIPPSQFDARSFYLLCWAGAIPSRPHCGCVWARRYHTLLAPTINSPPIKMWNCLTQHSEMHFSVWRRVFANSPQINALLLPSETIVCKTIGNLWESIVEGSAGGAGRGEASQHSGELITLVKNEGLWDLLFGPLSSDTANDCLSLSG